MPQVKNPKADVDSSAAVPDAAPRKSSINSEGRRASAASGSQFSALNYQKRALGDPLAAARRESFNDQRRESGWIGGLWDNWTRGGSVSKG